MIWKYFFTCLAIYALSLFVSHVFGAEPMQDCTIFALSGFLTLFEHYEKPKTENHE